MSGAPARILHLAPWVDYGGSDSGTVDWFRSIDRARFSASLITTQVSPNRRLNDVAPHAEEVWSLPDLILGHDFPAFILDFIASRNVRVVHVMNSRLGYQMIPDIKRLPSPPAVVVQFHLEEPDRSGYVRYLCTRYGNLVDAYSVVSEHLVEALHAYDVPPDRCEVIRLGVDVELFDPARVRPIPLSPGVAHILYPGRLTAQKDPLLMVEVAAALRHRGAAFKIHCVGDGDLTDDIAAAVRERGLDDAVILHGPSPDMPRWYAACDLVLMTSAYEGVPCVVYEAMAMARPLVVPALPGNAEVVDAGSGVLIAPRDDAGAYADALALLIADPGRRAEMGARARRVACERYTLAEMGARHTALYDRLTRATPPAPPRPPRSAPPPILLRTRPPTESPLVSVIIPCHDDGRYLVEALASVRRQTYAPVEVIVVDDASTDPETCALLDQLERSPDTVVIRQPENRGPAAARNRALEVARGRYVLPLDADNVLAPDALDHLVRRLRSAGERIGFIYPDQAYFGNRRDYHHAPAYNMHTLLHHNTCDTGSLIDREVFEGGVRFAEDIRFGHEDWNLFVTLAERDVRGEPAGRVTMSVRKAGFTRSDLVDIRYDEAEAALRARHPGLYGAEAAIKARWSPALSIVALSPLGDEAARRALAAAAAAQTCIDAELIVRDSSPWPRSDDGINVRTLHPELAGGDDAEALVHGARAARGQFVMAVRGDGLELLADPAFVEKTLRVFARTEVVVLVDAGDPAVPPMRLLDTHQSQTAPVLPLLESSCVRDLPPVAVAWRPHPAARLEDLCLSPAGDPLAELTTRLTQLIVEWRQAPPPSRRTGRALPRAVRTTPSVPPAVLCFAPPTSPSLVAERIIRLGRAPMLPGLDADARPDWYRRRFWRPPLARRLFRHVEVATGHRQVSGLIQPPHGYAREYELGWIHLFPLDGTLRLVREGQSFAAVPPGDADDPATTLGYLEEVPFWGLDAVHVAFPDDGGPATLVAGDDDPLLGACRLGSYLGRIEPSPIRPRQLLPHPLAATLAALSESRQEAEAAREQLELTHRHAADLERRLDDIEAALPFRAYRRARSLTRADRVIAAIRRASR